MMTQNIKFPSATAWPRSAQAICAGRFFCYNLFMWYLYILQTKFGQFYTGITNDVKRRMAEHKDGKGAKFTRNFGFQKLLYIERFSTKSDALKREKQIQGWTRKQKSALIKQ